MSPTAPHARHRFTRWFTVWVLSLAVCCIMVLSFAATAAAQDGPRDISVRLLNFSFEPGTIHVTAGETVRFMAHNDSNMLHTFTVTWSETDTRDPLVDEPLAPGEAREILFTVPTDVTSLHLYCVPHEDRMIGALTVVPAGDEPDGDQAPGEPSADPSSGTVPGGLMAWLAAALLLGAAGLFLLRRRQPADR